MNIDFNTDYLLENDKVLLRPLLPEDITHLVQFAIQEPEIWKYSLMKIEGKESLENYIQQAVEHRRQGKEYPFVVYDKIKKQYAGSTRFYDIQIQNQSVQLGYTWYGKQFQGTYLNKNCKYLLLQWAFEQMGCLRVELRADARNERSYQAMLSIGCVKEGIIRGHMNTGDGTRRSSLLMSILKEEWEAEVKEKLGRKILA
jgi:RimJ/RimL family protein N-acetyltransferase